MAEPVDPSTRAISVPSIIEHFTDAELNSDYHSKSEYQNAIDKYGVIYKTVQFSEETDINKIKQFCYEWIRRNYFDGVLSFDVKAVDLHLLGYPRDKLICGDRMKVEFMDAYKTPETKTLTCLSAQYDLLKPENSSFKVGIPDVSIDVKYRSSVTKKSSSSNNTNKEEPEVVKDFPGVLVSWWQYLGGIDVGTDPQNGNSNNNSNDNG